MKTITREQAICMLYCVPFNDENVKKFVPTTDALKSLEICYKEDPMEPIVISIYKMNAYPFLYKRYSVNQKESHIEDSTGVNKNQMYLAAHFLNIVFLPADPFNKEVYNCKQVEMKEILSFIRKHSCLFNKQNVSSLGKWLKSAKVILTDSPIKRIYRSMGEKVQVRNRYVLKDEYLGKFDFNL
ncbi:hypothetical protein K501DRAFT_190514 [Backusella circina FSU 941]|nr:hypothetical protein K501DRAFT_190514 [Backusella circina FSU 941]